MATRTTCGARLSVAAALLAAWGCSTSLGVAQTQPAGQAIFVGDTSTAAAAGPFEYTADSVGASRVASAAGYEHAVPYGDPSVCGAPCDACGELCCECPPRRNGFVFGEFLYLRPTGGDVTHAQQQNGIGGAGTVPFGDIGVIGQDYEPGFRVGFGVALNECASITSSYTFFESSNEESIGPPAIFGGGGAVGSLVHHPQAAITASVGPVDATQSIDFQMADVLFHDRLIGCDWCAINYSLGAVFGDLSQEFGQTGVFAGGAAGTIDTDTMIDFSGGGLKAGVDLERHVGRGVVVYGKLSAAALSGRFNADYTMLNSTTDVLLAQASWEDNRVVSHVEYEIGLSLRTCNDRFRVSAGYQFQHWGNVVTTSEWIDSVQANNYTDMGDTLSFDGLVARVEARW